MSARAGTLTVLVIALFGLGYVILGSLASGTVTAGADMVIGVLAIGGAFGLGKTLRLI